MVIKESKKLISVTYQSLDENEKDLNQSPWYSAQLCGLDKSFQTDLCYNITTCPYQGIQLNYFHIWLIYYLWLNGGRKCKSASPKAQNDVLNCLHMKYI